MAGETPWQSQKLEYDGSDNLVYVGQHKTPGANESDPGWYVQKLGYDGSGNLTSVEGPRLGSWTGRAGLF